MTTREAPSANIEPVIATPVRLYVPLPDTNGVTSERYVKLLDRPQHVSGPVPIKVPLTGGPVNVNCFNAGLSPLSRNPQYQNAFCTTALGGMDDTTMLPPVLPRRPTPAAT